VTEVIDRKRLKFEKDYTYLNRNMIMDEHPEYIYNSLLNYFKKEDLHQYPDMWETYDILSKYIGVSEEQLLITRGVEGAIKQTFDTLNIDGESIGITSPSFAMYNVYAEAYNVNIISVKGEYPECKISVNQIKEIVPSIKVLFLDNPKSHLPTYFNHKELFDIIKYCEKYGVIVFIDEVYSGWEYESYLPKLSKHNNLIISGSFSKIAFPSIKSGWLVTNKKLKKQIESTRNSYELDYFACKSIEFLIDNHNYIDDLKKNLMDTKNRWYENLLKSKKFKVYNSKNYVLRLYSENENLIKETYENLYKKKIVLGLVDRFNLVFSVTNNKKIEEILLNEILSNNKK